jgi:hypothetical protein
MSHHALLVAQSQIQGHSASIWADPPGTRDTWLLPHARKSAHTAPINRYSSPGSAQTTGLVIIPVASHGFPWLMVSVVDAPQPLHGLSLWCLLHQQVDVQSHRHSQGVGAVLYPNTLQLIKLLAYPFTGSARMPRSLLRAGFSPSPIIERRYSHDQ